MTNTHATGDKVTWHWGRGTAESRVEKIHTDKVTKTLKGTTVTRNATKEEPAYTIRQKQGPRMTHVLKSHSELHETN